MSKLTILFFLLTFPLFSQDYKSKNKKIISDIKSLNELIKNRDIAFLRLEEKPQKIDPLCIFYGYQFLIFDKFEELRNKPLSRKQKRELKRISAKINVSKIDNKIGLYYFLNGEHPPEPLK